MRKSPYWIAVGLSVLPLVAIGWLRAQEPAESKVSQADAPPLKALVYEIVDPWSKADGAAELLKAAGFEVEPLPLDESPWLLDADVIFLGSFVSEDPAYAAYMKKYGADLYNYVDKGHLLVQFTQADQTEAEPPFLPTTQGATRSDQDFDDAYILSPEHPMAQGLPTQPNGRIHTKGKGRTIWETFVHQSGFHVILAGDPEARFPGLMEGAYGQGRILLSAMWTDKTTSGEGADIASPEQKAFNEVFFKNLAAHALSIRNRTTPALSVTAAPAPPDEFIDGTWTMVVLPDTQVYSLRNPGLFTLQTHWVAQQREARDIRMVLQLGDIVNNNTPLEWERADSALNELLKGEVPIALVPGNHDYGPSGNASTRDTLMNEYLDFSEHSAQPTFGGAMEPGKLDNTFHTFEAGGKKWIVIALEWGPRDSTIAWANEVMKQHPGHRGVLITHAYMNNNDLRYDYTDTANPQHYNPHEYRTPGGVNDGEELWQKLVRHYDFAFAINGHVLGDGTGYLVSQNDTGTITHQILTNFQMRELGGEAYLRLFEFLPDGVTVRVKTYSPLYDDYLLEPDQSFTLKME